MGIVYVTIQDEAAIDPVVFEPSIVQTVAGEGQITFKYFSNDVVRSTTAQLLPSFTTEEVCVVVINFWYVINDPISSMVLI